MLAEIPSQTRVENFSKFEKFSTILKILIWQIRLQINRLEKIFMVIDTRSPVNFK